eukprot:s1976_g4.t1
MLCNKCRQCPPNGTDTWCLGCTATEALLTDLSSKWSTAALRAVANDLVVSAARGVSALRGISSSIQSAGQARAANTSSPGARASVAAEREPEARPERERSRSPLQRIKQPEPSSEGDDEEEEEEDAEADDTVLVPRGATAKSSASPRPPEPPHPPRGHSSRGASPKRKRHHHHSEQHRDRRGDHKEGKKKKRGNRGGPLLALVAEERTIGMEIVEGREYKLEDKNEWDLLVVGRGDVVEVHLPSTNLEAPPDIWAGFWVKQVMILPQGDYAAAVKSLGCSDPDWTRWLSGQFNRRHGRFHFCPSKPCAVTDDFTLHVTRVKIFSVDAFDRPYLTAHMKRQIPKWEEEDLVEDDEWLDVSGLGGRRDPPPAVEHEEEEEGPPADPRVKPPKEIKEKKEAERPGAKPKEKPAKDPGKTKPKPFTDAEREELRKRLNKAKEKIVARGVEGRAGPGANAAPEERGASILSSTGAYSPSVAPEDGAQALQDLKDPEDGKRREKPKRETGREEKKKKKSREERKKGDGGLGSRNVGALEDIKGATTKNLQNQLLRKAAETAKEKEQKEKAEKKKQHKKDPTWQLARILTTATKGARKKQGDSEESSKDGEDPKEKRKKKKKKRRRTSDGGSSPTGSSDDDWSNRSSSSSDSKAELVAPLRKKSKKKPGSVLQMLLQHARSQLDQGAKVQVGDAESVTMTSGVRMGSYFAICVRPQLGSAMAQARELHHLAQAIDLLRQGSLDVLGDVLAGRFMSLHQSVIDNSWVTARHLELMPLEEGSAAGPEVVLQAKKHARLAARLAPGEQWSWGGGGKAKGGRGKSSSWQENSWEPKGKGKKGSKGKGKTKSWNATERETETRAKEKPAEK